MIRLQKSRYAEGLVNLAIKLANGKLAAGTASGDARVLVALRTAAALLAEVSGDAPRIRQLVALVYRIAGPALMPVESPIPGAEEGGR